MMDKTLDTITCAVSLIVKAVNGIEIWKKVRTPSQVADARLCRKTPSSARERAFFPPGKDGEAGDVGFIVDIAGCSQVEKGPIEARSGFPTEPRLRFAVNASSMCLHRAEMAAPEILPNA